MQLEVSTGKAKKKKGQAQSKPKKKAKPRRSREEQLKSVSECMNAKQTFVAIHSTGPPPNQLKDIDPAMAEQVAASGTAAAASSTVQEHEPMQTGTEAWSYDRKDAHKDLNLHDDDIDDSNMSTDTDGPPAVRGRDGRIFLSLQPTIQIDKWHMHKISQQVILLRKRP